MTAEQALADRSFVKNGESVGAERMEQAEHMEQAERMEQLVRQAGQGNRQALSELCKAVGRKALFIAMRLMPSHPEAEDVAQEALIHMCENIHTLKDPRAFHVWMHRIVLNDVRQHARKNAGHSAVLYLEDVTDDIPEDNEDVLPLEYALRREDQRIVIEIVDTLPDRMKEAVLLRYYQGFTVTEVADVMAITKQTASSYLKGAREKIRTELERRARRETGGMTSNLAFLPIGPLVAQAFSQEAAFAGTAGTLWANKTAEICVQNLQDLQAKPATTGASVPSKPVMLVAVLVGSIICISAVMAGVDRQYQDDPALYGGGAAKAGTPINPAQEDEGLGQGSALPVTPVGGDAEVIFEGGDADFAHLNPRKAHVENSNGDVLTPQGWEIKSFDNDMTLLSGAGDLGDTVFTGLPEGEYWLVFTLESPESGQRTCSCSFQIMNGFP